MLHKTVMLIALVPSLALAGPKEANEAFVKGQAAYKAKSYAEAERLFRKAVNEDSANAQFRLPLAKSMYKQKRYDEAIHELKQLIKIAPTMAAARYQMALVQRKAGMASPLPADQTAYLKEAVGFYKGYLAVEQQDPDGYYGLAETYRLLGEARLSISNYERYVELEKRPKEQKYVKKAKQKIADLKAALAGGVVAGQKPVLSKAAAPYHRKIAAQSIVQGDSFRAAGNASMAADSYRDATLRDPKSLEAHFKLGGVLAETGDLKGAQTALLAANKLDPTSEPIKGNLKKVTETLAKVGEKKKEEESGDLATGLDLLSKSQFEQALISLAKAADAKPNHHAVHLALGTCQLAMDNRSGALKSYGRALVLRPDLSLAHFGLAEVYRLEGDRDRAKSHYNSYLASSGEDRNGAYDDQARNRLGVLGN